MVAYLRFFFFFGLTWAIDIRFAAASMLSIGSLTFLPFCSAEFFSRADLAAFLFSASAWIFEHRSNNTRRGPVL